MPPVAMPATASCRKSARLLAQLGQYLDDLLPALHHLDQEADAVDVALLIPGRLHQDARLLLRLDGEALHQLAERLAVELAQLLGGVLDGVDRGVALDAVMVRYVLVALLELVGERLHRRDRRIGGESHVTLYALGRLAGEVDDLL